MGFDLCMVIEVKKSHFGIFYALINMHTFFWKWKRTCIWCTRSIYIVICVNGVLSLPTMPKLKRRSAINQWDESYFTLQGTVPLAASVKQCKIKSESNWWKFVALVHSINGKQVPAVHLRCWLHRHVSVGHFLLDPIIRSFGEILSSDTVSGTYTLSHTLC